MLQLLINLGPRCLRLPLVGKQYCASASYETLNGERLVLKGKRCVGNGIVLYLQLRDVDYNWEWMGKTFLITSWVALANGTGSCKPDILYEATWSLYGEQLVVDLIQWIIDKYDIGKTFGTNHWYMYMYEQIKCFISEQGFPKCLLVSITEKLFIKLALWKRHIHSKE